MPERPASYANIILPGHRDFHGDRTNEERPPYRTSIECPSCGAPISVDPVGLDWVVRSPRDVADRLVLQMANLEREQMHVLLLNTRNRVTGQTVVYLGNVSSTLVRVSELFTPAVRAGASSILVAHGHPSGEIEPSPDDIAVTDLIRRAGDLLQIPLLDHLIVGRGGYTSLRDRGLLGLTRLGTQHPLNDSRKEAVID